MSKCAEYQRVLKKMVATGMITETAAAILDAGPVGPCDNVECQECCEHDEHDHGVCLNCEKDISDDLIRDADDAFEREE